MNGRPRKPGERGDGSKIVPGKPGRLSAARIVIEEQPNGDLAVSLQTDGKELQGLNPHRAMNFALDMLKTVGMPMPTKDPNGLNPTESVPLKIGPR